MSTMMSVPMVVSSRCVGQCLRYILVHVTFAKLAALPCSSNCLSLHQQNFYKYILSLMVIRFSDQTYVCNCDLSHAGHTPCPCRICLQSVKRPLQMCSRGKVATFWKSFITKILEILYLTQVSR